MRHASSTNAATRCGSRRRRVLEVRSFGEDPRPGAGEARGRLAAGRHQQEKRGHRFEIGDLTALDCVGAHPDERVRVVLLRAACREVHVDDRPDVHHRRAELGEALVRHEAADRFDRRVPLLLERRRHRVVEAEDPRHHDHRQRLGELAHPLDASGRDGGVEHAVDQVAELGLHLLHHRRGQSAGHDLPLTAVVGRVGSGQHRALAGVEVRIGRNTPEPRRASVGAMVEELGADAGVQRRAWRRPRGSGPCA